MRTRLPGKDLIMKHTPYGYDIVGGAAVINEEQAANLRRLCENYLSGMSFVQAAKDAGLGMKHSGVRTPVTLETISTPRYLPPRSPRQWKPKG